MEADHAVSKEKVTTDGEKQREREIGSLAVLKGSQLFIISTAEQCS